MKRNALVLTIAAASAIALSACGGPEEEEVSGSPDPTPATSVATEADSGEEVSAEHNDADVMFAQMMIPHHQQAVEMSEMLLAKDDVPQETADFAQGVMDAQGPEIERMNAMLEAWGEDPVTESDDMGDHGDMSGMMSEDDMNQLEDAAGADAAQLYLEQMIEHHEGAVEMAEEQVSGGENPQAVALAEQVIDDQETEITEMETMLDEM